MLRTTILLFLVAVASVAWAEDSPLVALAKRTNRKASSRPVITNETVAASKGRISVSSAEPVKSSSPRATGAPAPAAPSQPQARATTAAAPANPQPATPAAPTSGYPASTARNIEPTSSAQTITPQSTARTIDPSTGARTIDPQSTAGTIQPASTARNIEPQANKPPQ